MQDFLDSFWEWFKEKTTSPLYATYIFCFVVNNWRIFFTLFFQDSSVLELPKIEYIQQHYFADHGWWKALNYLRIFGLPALYTLFIIRYLPPIVTWAHRLNVKHYLDRKGIYEDALLAYEKNKNIDLKELAVVKSEQASAIKTIEKLTPEKEVWERELKELRGRLAQVKFKEAVDTMYEQAGYRHQMPTGFVAFGDVHGLIDIDEETRVSLTPKGKFFAKSLFSETGPN